MNQPPKDFDDVLGRAISLKNQERYTEATQLLEDLAERYPESASVHALLGDIQWEENKLAQAIASFRTTVKLAPMSVLASVALFHTLLEAGDKEEAVLEAKRFVGMIQR